MIRFKIKHPSPWAVSWEVLPPHSEVETCMALTWGRKSESQRRELYYLRSYIWEEVGLDFEHTYLGTLEYLWGGAPIPRPSYHMESNCPGY